MYTPTPSTYALPVEPQDYASSPVPSLAEWQKLWHLWDTVSRRMIPEEELMEKPIKLRNALIFYLGHIPTFLNMKLAQTTDGKYTEPAYFPSIFERGIDPDVDNPEQCHAHSEVPDDWPPLDEIQTHQQRVRERLQKLYIGGQTNNAKVARCVWLGYEHEAMHLETLLYMLVQSDKTLCPPGIDQPGFKTLADQDAKAAVSNAWFDIPNQNVKLNLDDPETDDSPPRYFGWDIEKPAREAHVPAFQAKARPITNGEYAQYMLRTGSDRCPASWSKTMGGLTDTTGRSTINGQADETNAGSHVPQCFLAGKSVRTVYGKVPLEYALGWPVSASFDEIAGCAAYMGGRIPTMEEAQSIYTHADHMRQAEAAAQALGKTIPAVNSHLVNDGVEESPPPNGLLNGASASAAVQGELDPNELFVGLRGKNVGFHNWTPTSVLDKGNELQGRGGMGGLWEWTSSTLRKHDGFEPMKLYEAYSQDFFDGKHNIVLTGSWATVPRIAGRKSFINWYQRGYPYVWAGARLVRDIHAI